ncbi:MAG TPA: hypothetical protein VFO16_06530 [Pseudonocardiaceae bacterium]|nr:hypothetical protein [Pseudonocardiaceae bacterium]
MADGPYLAAAKRLLDAAKLQGFSFERVAPGEDGPLRGELVTLEHQVVIYIGGFWEGCNAARSRRSSLIVPGEALVIDRVSGDALTVLHTVVTEWLPT